MSALKPFTLLCLPCLCLAACAEPVVQGTVAQPGFAADYTNKASSCSAPAVSVTDGKDVTATISTGGSGWCGIPVTRDGNPLGAGLLIQQPKNGSVYVHLVGNVTRVDYTPRGAVMADSFVVKFIPGDSTMRVTVTPPASAAK